MTAEPDAIAINRAAWTKANALYADARAPSQWDAPEITWGVWATREADLGVLPDVSGADVLEAGCGTAYFGSWLKRAGARRVVGIDITPAQLATARRLNEQRARGLELVEADAEVLPFAGGTFDLVVSEYGASIWCDPHRWIVQAHRALRPGGELVFLANSVLSMLCMPDSGPVGERLERPQRGMGRLVWTDDDPGVEFHLGHGEMFRLLRASGFDVVDLVELFAPGDARDHPIYSYVSAAWAARWPAEEIWRARKR